MWLLVGVPGFDGLNHCLTLFSSPTQANGLCIAKEIHGQQLSLSGVSKYKANTDAIQDNH